jgi:hypothetical protein
MGEKGRLGLLRWKTKSSNVPWVGVLNAIYEQDFLGFHTDFDQDAASTMRWMHSRSGLRTRI